MKMINLIVVNAVSALRIVLAPFVVYFAAKHNWLMAFVLLIVSVATDLCDVALARKLSAQSRFGEMVMENISDSTMSIGAVGGLLFAKVIPLWLVCTLGSLFALEIFTFFLKKKEVGYFIRVAFYLFVMVVITAVYAAKAIGFVPTIVVFTVCIPIIVFLKRERLKEFLGI